MADELMLPQKKNRKLFILVIASLLFLVFAGGGIWFLFFSEQGKALNASITTEEPQMEAVVSYLPINEPFIFNVKGRSRDRLAQISVQLQVRGEDNYKLAMDNLSVIQSSIARVFRSATVEELKDGTGRDELRTLALEAAQADLTLIVKKPVLEKLLFTDFVIQ